MFYLACRWDYDKTPKTMLRDSGQMALVTAKKPGSRGWLTLPIGDRTRNKPAVLPTCRRA